jgi:phosphopantothenoylcysteine decarboxylase/phosphopantothenate--cysteine ligase
VGFAAESEKLEQHAREKLRRKKLPLIVGNLGPATFGRDDNALLLVDAQTTQALPADGSAVDKLTLARELVAEIARRVAQWQRGAAA